LIQKIAGLRVVLDLIDGPLDIVEKAPAETGARLLIVDCCLIELWFGGDVK
jgi:hypothetical protein